MKKGDLFPVILLVLFLIGLVVSAINPKDYLTWGLEIFPAVFGILILIFTYRRFRFSNLTYFFVFVYSIVLLVGGHYTYGDVPLFNWLKDVFGFSRNHYDRFAHFLLGLVPAFIATEIAVRKKIINGVVWVRVLIVAFVLAIGAFYEIFEGVAGLTYGARTTDFLGMQGDIWDTQWDLFWVLVGSICSVFVRGKYIRNNYKKKVM